MSDTVPFTSGSGNPSSTEVIAADDCGAAGKAQIVKLAVSADADATLFPATTAGLSVVLSTQAGTLASSTSGLPASTAAIGNVTLLASTAAIGTLQASTVAIGTVALSTVAGTLASSTSGLPASTAAIGNVTLLASTASIGSLAASTAKVGALQASTESVGIVVLSTAAGTLAASTAGLPASTANIGGVFGNVAHDSTDPQTPVGIGLQALGLGANPTAVAAGDRTVWYANRAGIPWVLGGHPFTRTIEFASTAASTDSSIIAASTSISVIVTQAQAMTDVDNTTAVGFRIGFSTGVTPTTTGVLLTHPGMNPGVGVSRGDGSGVIGQGLIGESVVVTHEIPTGGAFRALLTYFTIASTS